MRKYWRILALVLIVALVLAAVAGCGSSDKEGTQGNQTEGKSKTEIFADAQEKMAEVESFSTTGTVTLQMDELEGMGTGSSELEIPFEAEVANAQADSPDVHMTLDLGFLGALFGGGEEIPGLDSLEMYIVDQALYMNIMGAWYQATADDLGAAVPASGDPSAFIELADEAEVVDETSDYIEYEVVINAEKLEELLAELELDSSDADVEDLQDALKETVFTIKVDKDSGYPIDMSFVMTADLSSLGDLGGGLVPAGESTISFEASFADFNEDVEVELPDEARDAMPLDELFNSFFGGGLEF